MDETTILVAIACLVVGLVVGSLLTRTLSPQEKKCRELEQQLQAKDNELKTYQRDVSEHLVKTSELIGEMNRSQRAISEQLTRGATLLASADVSRQVQNTAFAGLEQSPGMNILSVTPQEPPKDYAPGGGVLSENYGLQDEPPSGTTRGLKNSDTASEGEREEEEDPTQKIS